MDRIQLTDLLKQAITYLCRDKLSFDTELCVEGLLGITLDNRDVFLVNIKETLVQENEVAHAITSDDTRTKSNDEWPKKRKRRKASTVSRMPPSSTPSGTKHDDTDIPQRSAFCDLPALTESDFHSFSYDGYGLKYVEDGTDILDKEETSGTPREDRGKSLSMKLELGNKFEEKDGSSLWRSVCSEGKPSDSSNNDGISFGGRGEKKQYELEESKSPKDPGPEMAPLDLSLSVSEDEPAAAKDSMGKPVIRALSLEPDDDNACDLEEDRLSKDARDSRSGWLRNEIINQDVLKNEPDIQHSDVQDNGVNQDSEQLDGSLLDTVANIKQENSFVCICSRAFSQQMDYIKHIGQCYKSKLTPYKSCEICGKSFFSNSGYVKHKRLHVGAYKFLCEICHKGFFDRTHLRAHMDSSHSKVRRYECERCLKSFFWKHHLKRHQLTCDSLYRGQSASNPNPDQNPGPSSAL